MPWLWRFWMKIPRQGQMAIFDRSWYGRVTIERVEHLTPIPDWIRAYEEINEFERTLANDGCVFMKFWLHISRKEQLRRFLLLSGDRTTAWQVSSEDWERHQKYDEYRAAVVDMLENTNTSYGPWTVVPATDKRYRIYHILKVIIDTLERALGAEKTVWPTIEELESIAASGDLNSLTKLPESPGAAESLFWEYVARRAEEEE
jgi:polyphosphate kinase 2 (PPK2 family)